MIKNYKAFLFLAASVTLSGCASMFGDNTRSVSVNSTPQGASIFVDNVEYGKTPATITLPNYIYSGRVVTLKKEGFVTQSTSVNTKFQPVGIWNILNGFGFLIDAATGDIVKIDPTNLNLNLTLQANSTSVTQSK